MMIEIKVPAMSAVEIATLTEDLNQVVFNHTGVMGESKLSHKKELEYKLPTKEDIIRESKELDSENIIDSSYQMGWKEGAYWYLQRIEKAREVASAICPELGEPTIKSVTNCITCGSECDVNTDGTTHYYVSKTEYFKAEMKEAVELLKQVLDVNTPTWESHENINTFLTKHKSK